MLHEPNFIDILICRMGVALIFSTQAGELPAPQNTLI